jgi:hypothetical protein
MGRVFYLPDLKPTQKLVLLALADHADDDGSNCYPSMERLEKKTALGLRRLQQIIGELQAAGYVSREINAATGSRGQIAGNRRPNHYELCIPDHSPSSTGAKPGSQQGRNSVQERGTESPPTLSVTISEPPAPPTSRARPKSDGNEWFEQWCIVAAISTRGDHNWRDAPGLSDRTRAAAMEARHAIRYEDTTTARLAFRAAYLAQGVAA